MLKRLLLIGGTVFLASVGPVFAEESVSRAEEPSHEHAWSRPGWYVFLGGSAGIDQAFGDTLEDLIGLSVDVEDSVGFKFKLGSRSFRYLALELELEYLPGFETKVVGIPALETDIFTATANVKLFPLNGRVQPYVLLGAGLMSVSIKDSLGLGLSASDSGPAIKAGGGLDLYMTEHLALALDLSYVLPAKAVVDFDYLSIGFGLQYKF